MLHSGTVGDHGIRQRGSPTGMQDAIYVMLTLAFFAAACAYVAACDRLRRG